MTTTFTPHLTLGERLARARQHAGMNQQEMADQLSIHKRSIVNYENDEREPRFAVVCAWAKATTVPLDYFADATTPPSSDPNGRQDFTNRPLPFPNAVDIDLTGDNVRPFRHHQPAPLVPAA